LQEIVGINPGVRFLVSPWSAPAWMKSNNSLIGGSLRKEYFAAYAAYLLNYLQAMAEQGIAIYALTIQNEPLHPGNNPSMYMSKEDQYDFVQYYLGPALQKSPFPAVRLLAYDHNCDNIEYPVYVARSEYITGSAFHLYAGPIEALSTVYQQTKKDIYFTEQWTSGKGRFDEDFTFHIREVMLGSVNNWSKTALSWNVASNEKWEPYTPEGGCNLCKGAITIDSETKSVIRNVTYYTTAQMSKVIRSGAVRIASETANNQLVHAAFINPCGSTALVVFNKGDKLQNFDIQWNGKICTYALEGHTVASLIWNEK
jgi:glucosylceramidase